jgi:hypothetical protein
VSARTQPGVNDTDSVAEHPGDEELKELDRATRRRRLVVKEGR